MKKIIVIVPPDTEVVYMHSQHVDRPLAIDADLLDKPIDQAAFSSGVGIFGQPVYKAEPHGG